MSTFRISRSQTPFRRDRRPAPLISTISLSAALLLAGCAAPPYPRMTHSETHAPAAQVEEARKWLSGEVPLSGPQVTAVAVPDGPGPDPIGPVATADRAVDLVPLETAAGPAAGDKTADLVAAAAPPPALAPKSETPASLHPPFATTVVEVPPPPPPRKSLPEASALPAGPPVLPAGPPADIRLVEAEATGATRGAERVAGTERSSRWTQGASRLYSTFITMAGAAPRPAKPRPAVRAEPQDLADQPAGRPDDVLEPSLLGAEPRTTEITVVADLDADPLAGLPVSAQIADANELETGWGPSEGQAGEAGEGPVDLAAESAPPSALTRIFQAMTRSDAMAPALPARPARGMPGENFDPAPGDLQATRSASATQADDLIDPVHVASPIDALVDSPEPVQAETAPEVAAVIAPEAAPETAPAAAAVSDLEADPLAVPPVNWRTVSTETLEATAVAPRTVVAPLAQLASISGELPKANVPLEPISGLQVVFDPGSSMLSQDARDELTGLAHSLDLGAEPRLRLSAVAAGEDLSPAAARRLTLARLIAVRDFLLTQGLDGSQVLLLPKAAEQDKDAGDAAADLVELAIDRS